MAAVEVAVLRGGVGSKGGVGLVKIALEFFVSSFGFELELGLRELSEVEEGFVIFQGDDAIEEEEDVEDVEEEEVDA